MNASLKVWAAGRVGKPPLCAKTKNENAEGGLPPNMMPAHNFF